MTIVELVRHAKAGSREQWTEGPDRDRPLSSAGRDQAAWLTTELAAGEPVAGLYTSPLARCRQTLEPLSAALGVPLVECDALAEASGVPVVDAGSLWVASAWLAGRAAGLIDRLVAAHAGERVVCCSHGDVLSSLLALVSGRDGLSLADTHLRKAARATLIFDGPVCTDVAFVDAPPPRQGAVASP